MNLLRVVPMALVLGLFGGCATTKPAMPDERYEGFTKAWFGIHYCNSKGWISPDVAARGKGFVSSGLQSYSYDPARMDRELSSLQSNNLTLAQSDCNNLAMAIQGRSQQIAVQNQNNESEQRATQELINSTKIKNTYCNRIGNSMFCNTY